MPEAQVYGAPDQHPPHENPASENPPWLFGFLSIPGGFASSGINALLIPFLLRQHGVPVDRIAEVVAIATVPWVWNFLWAPVVDLGLKWRTWILWSYGLYAVSSAVAILESAGSVEWLTTLLFAANVLGSVGSSTVGAVLSTVRPEVRGRASGWVQAGNVGAGTLGGGVGIWMAGFAGLPVIAAVCAAALFLPALAAFRIVEKPQAGRMGILPLFAALGRDMWDVLWNWRTFAGLLFFLSPAGTGAVTNLISSVGPDYHASNAEVAWISGVGGGLLLGAGGLVGGYVCDRLHRMTAYAVFGMLCGGFAAGLALAPKTPVTYGVGYAGYALATGFAYAAFTALVLEVLGQNRRAAATGYSLLVSAANLPIAYMTWLDGVGYKHVGARGLMGVDALANGAGGLVLLAIARYCAYRWRPRRVEIPTAV